MKRLAFLISNAGRGSNLQAVIDAIVARHLNATIAIVVSDSAEAYGLTRAKKHKIPCEIVDKNTDLTKLLKDTYKIDYVCLAGWKRIIPDLLISAFKNKILNVHPGLIPDTPTGKVKNPDGTPAQWNKGKFTSKAIQNFIDARATYAGSTVHLLSHEFDFGPVLERVFEKIKSGDTVDSLYSRLKKKENKAYVDALKKLCSLKSILIIGSIGREHALGWKLAQSPKVGKIYFSPGNGGTSQIGENVPLDITRNKTVVDFAKKNNIDLVVVPSDDPLAQGMVDDLKKAGIAAFGPKRKAAQIEWSKTFAKELMKEEKIPTANFETFTDFEKAKKYLVTQSYPIVIKASGLALGKGVIIAQDQEEAESALSDIMIKKVFGTAGDEVVIEEMLYGQEISIHAFCDGRDFVLFPSSQDHKPVFDKDRGPNTGGMGTIAPVPWVKESLMKSVANTIVAPTLKALEKRGRKYVGVLYPGLMITPQGPKVIEINSRFGDPETEAYVRLLKTDIYDIFMACVAGSLKKLKIEWSRQFACCIVLASAGYPGKYEKGIPIEGVEAAQKDKDVLVFHFGTRSESGTLITAGGRVLGVTAVGRTLSEALQKAYRAIKKVHFKGMQYRKDIGRRPAPKVD